MRINNNLMAMNTHRQLGMAQNSGANSMEKLSSGFRINRAGDDAAGLSISEKMRGQIRGLNQASSNAQDGISMIQTAEGALNETHSILQRMRELAVQSANDTNVDIDRDAIQNEMNQLSSEINRIGNTTEFNSQKILRGEGVDPTIKSEMNLPESGLVEEPTYLDGGKFTPAENAGIQVHFANDAVADDTNPVVIDESLVLEFNGDEITINFHEDDDNFDHGDRTINDAGTEIDLYIKDGTNKETVARLAQEALMEAIEINEEVDAADYTITRNENALNIQTVATGDGQSIAATGAEDNIISTDLNDNNNTGHDTITSAGSSAVREYADGEIEFKIAELKEQVLQSGISIENTDYFNGGALTVDGLISHLDGTGFTIGEESIEFFDGSDGEYTGNADFAVDLNDVTWANAGGDVETADLDALVAGIVDQIGHQLEGVELTNETATDQKLNIEARAAGKEGNSIEITDGVTRPATDIIGSTFEATFQIGANQGQGMTVELTDMRAEALGVVGKAGEDHYKVDGAVFTEVENVTNGTDNENYISSLDISSHEKATAAVTVLNDAIETVSDQRSSIGAFQNRLEHTISNLNNSQENLQAAESRIRDVDMAQEMMELTKQNILQQASTAMLAQANQAPQSVLQLLG